MITEAGGGGGGSWISTGDGSATSLMYSPFTGAGSESLRIAIRRYCGLVPVPKEGQGASGPPGGTVGGQSGGSGVGAARI